MYHDPFSNPFELWREDGILRLVISSDVIISVHEVKEWMRLLSALDPRCEAPLLVEQQGDLRLAGHAWEFAIRCGNVDSRSMALLVRDARSRALANLFLRSFDTAFPISVFSQEKTAMRWCRAGRMATRVPS